MLGKRSHDPSREGGQMIACPGCENEVAELSDRYGLCRSCCEDLEEDYMMKEEQERNDEYMESTRMPDDDVIII